MTSNSGYDFLSSQSGGDDEMDAIKSRAGQKPAVTLSPPPLPPGMRAAMSTPSVRARIAALPDEDDADLPDSDADDMKDMNDKDDLPEDNDIPETPPARPVEIRPEQKPIAMAPVTQVPPAEATFDQQPRADGPPLFIKVDRYKDIVKNVQQLRTYTVGLRDTLDALGEMEKELKVGVDMCHKALDRVNIVLTFLDTKFLRLQGLENVEPERQSDEIERYVRGVHEQMEKLKQNLKNIS